MALRSNQSEYSAAARQREQLVESESAVRQQHAQMLAAARSRGSGFFNREDQLADFDFLAGLHVNLLHDSCDWRWNFDRSFVGFDFEQCLFFVDFVASFDENLQQIATSDIFAQLGQLHFGSSRSASCRGSRFRLLSIGWRWSCGGRCAGLNSLPERLLNRRTSTLSDSCGKCFRSPLRLWRLRAILVERNDYLADLQLLALFDVNLADDSAGRRWNFDRGLIGFEFEQRLVFIDLLADFDEDLEQIARADVLPQFREFHFNAH